MILLLAALLLPMAALLGLLQWTRWLRRRRAAPAFASWIGYAFVALVGSMIVGSVAWGAVTLAQAGSAAGVAEKAAMLAMGISETLNDLAFAFCVAVIGALWLGFCSLAWRGRER